MLEAITNKDGKPLYPGYAEFQWRDEPLVDGWGTTDWVLLGIFEVQETEECLVGGSQVIRGYDRTRAVLEGATAQVNVLNKLKFLYGKKRDKVMSELRETLSGKTNEVWNLEGEVKKLQNANEEMEKDLKSADDLALSQKEAIKRLRGDMNGLLDSDKKLRRDLNALVEHFGKGAVQEVLSQFDEDDDEEDED